MKNSPSPPTQPGSPVLKILSGPHKGKQFRLLSSQITIGRHSDCDVIFKDNTSCSRQHARIEKKDNSYIIESLNPKNPVFINKKAVSSQVLKPKDKITIGNVEMLFLDNSLPVFPSKQPLNSVRSGKPKKKWLTPPRLILIVVFIAGLFLFLSGDKKEKLAEQLNLRTEADVLEEVEELEGAIEEEKERQSLNSMQKAARVAFIKGFRDYGKGYFQRALQMFRHCLTLEKNSSLCQSYSRKSEVQIDKLIQKKIRLGNAYKKNKQYEACTAAFKSVEIMIKDSKSAVYKEVRANRKLCEIQLENQI